MEKMSLNNYLDVSDVENADDQNTLKNKQPNMKTKSSSNSSKSISISRSESSSSRPKRKRKYSKYSSSESESSVSKEKNNYKRRDKHRDKKKKYSSSRRDKKSRSHRDRKDHRRHDKSKKKRKSKRRTSRSRSRSLSSSYSSDSVDRKSFSESSSVSRSRSRSHRRKKIRKFSSDDKIKNKISEKNIDYSVKKPKWSETEEIKDDRKIITLGGKPGKKSKDYNIDNLNEIKPNENITLEEKEKPNFEPSGLLAKQTNTKNGVEMKFTEPLDASIPDEDWRLYTFKDNQNEDILYINSKSVYLIGKDERAASILVNHPSCSRQHAVVQFRKIVKKNELGQTTVSIKPYLMDLESTNGTLLNKIKIEPARYYELKVNDILNFGFSTRDYIVMKVELEKQD